MRATRRRYQVEDFGGWDNVTVRIPAALRGAIRARMRAGGYKTFGEYLRYLLRLDLRQPVG
jgi:Arc/MetJ-type ribon-helix-helix transcriptional regulator